MLQMYYSAEWWSRKRSKSRENWKEQKTFFTVNWGLSNRRKRENNFFSQADRRRNPLFPQKKLPSPGLSKCPRKRGVGVGVWTIPRPRLSFSRQKKPTKKLGKRPGKEKCPFFFLPLFLCCLKRSIFVDCQKISLGRITFGRGKTFFFSHRAVSPQKIILLSAHYW